MEKENSNAYSEVIEILKLLDDEEKLEALPMEMLELLKSKTNPEYKPIISKEIPLEEQKLEPETLSILSWIAMKYWGDEIDKEEYYSNNENIKQEEIDNVKEQESIQEIKQIAEEESAENVNNIQENQEQTNTLLPILHKDLKWYQKIKIRIIEFFNRIFRKDKIKKENNKEEGTI